MSIQDNSLNAQVLNVLNQVHGKKRIIKGYSVTDYDDTAEFDYVLINEAGVFLIKLCDNSFAVAGGRDDSYIVSGAQKDVTRGRSIVDRHVSRYQHIKTFPLVVFAVAPPAYEAFDGCTDPEGLASAIGNTAEMYGKSLSKREIDKTYSTLLKTSSLANTKEYKKLQVGLNTEDKRRKGINEFVKVLFVFTAVLVIVTVIVCNLGYIRHYFHKMIVWIRYYGTQGLSQLLQSLKNIKL